MSERPSPAAQATEPLSPVPLHELRHLDAGRFWQIDQPVDGLASLTPVRGQLQATHRGTVLEVKGKAETIVTLCCDRCLQHFNRPLRAAGSELLWIGEPAQDPSDPVELGSAGDDPELMEQLDPRGSFDPEHWIFQQLQLQLPMVNHCGKHCPGPATWSSDSSRVDPRWRALQDLNP